MATVESITTIPIDAEFDEGESSVDLGFAEKCEKSVYLSSLFYPSKLGGRPAWLQWESLPNQEQLKCGNCDRQMIFLCQIYVPTDLPKNGGEGRAKLYHRTLYLFCCGQGACSKFPSFAKVFRAERLQCDDEPDYENSEHSDDELVRMCEKLESTHNLCNLCGCHGDKVCSSCHQVMYCSKEHQAIDWKFQHKQHCQNSVNSSFRSLRKHPLLFTEHEIVIEAEPPAKPVSNNIQYTHKDATKPTDKQLEKDLLKLQNQKADETFADFRERIDREPEQIIRYDLGGQPLWVSKDGQLCVDDIPDCRLCGGKRQFEFQVLPQLINYLGVETTVDSIDWGTMCVYTCAENCILNSQPYKEEFVWKQDIS